MIRSVRREEVGVPETSVDILKNALVYLENPTLEEREEVAREYGLHADTLGDALDPYEAPRFENVDGATYVFLRYPDTTNTESITTPLLLVVTDVGLIAIALLQPPFIEKYLSGSVVFDTSKPLSLFIKLQSEVDSMYSHALNGIQRGVNHKKRSINRITEKDIVELATYEMGLNDYMDALVPQTSVLTKLLSGKVFTLQSGERDVVEDLMLSANQHSELSKSLLKTTEDIRSAYMAISTERLNQVLKRLTALTLIIAIPTLITSFFGMNVTLPFQNNPDTVVGITVLIGIIAFIMLVIFSRQRWY
jgi:magnesium transporter